MERGDADRLPRVEESNLSDQTSHVPLHATLPPLRIHHFLAWMAVVAASMSFLRIMIGDEFYSRSWGVNSVVDTLCNALGVTVFGFVLVWRRAGQPIFSEPGHGLLLREYLVFVWSVVSAIAYACEMTRYDSRSLLLREEILHLSSWYLEKQWLIWTVAECLLSLACAYWIARSRQWRVFYCLVAACLSFQVFASVSFVVASENVIAWVEWLGFGWVYVPMVLIVTLLLYVIVRDRRDRLQHHWSHCCGVAGLLVTSLYSIANRIWWYLVS